MPGWLAIVHGDETERENLCAALRKHRYRAVGFPSLAGFEEHRRKSGCEALILDLDGLRVTNRVIRELIAGDRSLHVIAISSRTFHPELKEALSENIFACVRKPLDPDELLYLLGSISKNRLNPQAIPSRKEVIGHGQGS